MKRPHEVLGLPLPIGRRMSEIGKGTWIACIGIFVLFCVSVYVYQVSQAASKGFALRALEKQRDHLQETIGVLESRTAQMQSLRSMEEQMKGRGYVTVNHPLYLDVSRASYMLAK